MRFEDERYVRLYTRNTVTWRMLPWESRAVFPSLLRVMDRAGILELSDEDPMEAVAAMVDMPLEVVRPGMVALMRKDMVRITPKAIFLPKFFEAQEAHASDKARQQKARELARDLAKAESLIGQSVTPRDELSQGVTKRHALSHGVTPSRAVPSVPSCVEETESDGPPPPAAPAPAPEDLRAVWNEHSPPLPAWREMSPTRRKQAAARLRERPIGAWREVVRRIAASRFCRGESERGWRAGPDFLLKPDTAAKVLEGKYDDRAGDPRRGRIRPEEMHHTDNVGPVDIESLYGETAT